MIKKYIKIILFIICFTPVLIGCWDSRDIQNRNIITALIIDYKNNKSFFWTEVANIRGSRGQIDNNFSILKAQGDSNLLARDDSERKSDNPIFLGAVRAVIITNRMAENGIEAYMNRIRAIQDFRKTLDVVITFNEPEAFVHCYPNNDISRGFAIENKIKGLTEGGSMFRVTVGDILKNITVKNVGFAAPVIDPKEGQSTFTGYAVFKNEKMVGFIPAEKRKGLVELVAKKPRLSYEVAKDDNKFIIDAIMKKREIKPTFKNGRLTFEISMNFSGEINYMEKLVIIKDELRNEIQKTLENIIKNDIESTIAASQKEFKCDYFYFFKYFRMHYPQEFKKINWNEVYSEANIDVNVNVSIKPKGMFEINPNQE